MNQAELLRVGLIGLTFFASLAFVITYHLVAEWWHDDLGRSLMSYQIAMTIILGMSFFTALFGRTTWIVYIGLIVFMAIPIMLVWRTVALIKTRRQARKEDRK